ncbi:MAG: hypothetical protein LBG58_13390 [Planctomycetaceae bacterium]|jgi:hypothetical protein|nr:hypothetical protein [Planctomycetaceae bacterium]
MTEIRLTMYDIPVTVEQEFVEQDPFDCTNQDIVINFYPTITIKTVETTPSGAGYYVYLEISGSINASIGEAEPCKTGSCTIQKKVTFKNADGDVVETRTIGAMVWFTESSIQTRVTIFCSSNTAIVPRSCTQCSTAGLLYSNTDIAENRLSYINNNGIIYTINPVMEKATNDNYGNSETEMYREWYYLNFSAECPDGRIIYGQTTFVLGGYKYSYDPNRKIYGIKCWALSSCVDSSCSGNSENMDNLVFYKEDLNFPAHWRK